MPNLIFLLTINFNLDFFNVNLQIQISHYVAKQDKISIFLKT